MYGYTPDVNITQEQVLQKITQKEIFEFILEEPIDFSSRYTSPFRQDRRPGCRFEERDDGTILFIDFGDKLTTHRNCFKMVMDRFQVSHETAISIILGKFGLSTKKEDYNPITNPQLSSTEDIPTVIEDYVKIPYSKKDSTFWSQFLISTNSLLEDNVFASNRFTINGKKGRRKISVFNGCYVMDFISRHKIYQPNSKPEYKWITTCNENDIFNFDKLPASGKILTISKGYKDHRVLRDCHLDMNVIAFQNEGCVPDYFILKGLTDRFEKIVVFFDNDEAGAKAAIKICDIFNSIKPNCCVMVHLPVQNKDSWKDPAKFISKEGKKDLIQIVKQLYYYENILL